MFYVNLDKTDDDVLAFLGYTLIAEEGEFKLYRDHRGEEYIVSADNPCIYVEDMNDAIHLAGANGQIKLAPKG